METTSKWLTAPNFNACPYKRYLPFQSFSDISKLTKNSILKSDSYRFIHGMKFRKQQGIFPMILL